MMVPTIWIERSTRTGRDVHGQPLMKKQPREKVAPVKMIFKKQHSTVRTDSSGTHGHANEVTSDIVLLARPRSQIKHSDILTVAGHKVEVIELRPQYDVFGKVDHIEIHCAVWN